MKEIRISKKDVESFLQKLFEMQMESQNFFRGFSSINQLNPSLVRNYDRLNIWEKSDRKMGILEYEKFLLSQYAKYSVQYLPHFHNSLDWVASAQHFGLPTRLLDWSQDPFVALFFSCFYNKEPDDECYYLVVADKSKNMYYENIPDFTPDSTYLDITNINTLNSYILFVNSLLSSTGGVFTRLFRDEPKKEFCKYYKKNIDEEYKSEKRKLFYCRINESNPRIIAQKGLFQIPRRFIDEDDNDCIANDIFDASKMLYKIDMDCREKIIECLDNINISTPRLFPDLQNICEYIRSIDKI